MKLQDLNISYHILYHLGSTKEKRKEVSPMEIIKNLNGKRVCDRSEDGRVIQIVQRGCMTLITANPDGTLNVENTPTHNAA